MSDMTASKALKHLQNATARRRAAEDSERKWAQRYALLTCPYKVGETITCKAKTWTGKDCKVDRIGTDRKFSWSGPWVWRVYVKILKQDGTPHKWGSASWKATEETA